MHQLSELQWIWRLPRVRVLVFSNAYFDSLGVHPVAVLAGRKSRFAACSCLDIIESRHRGWLSRPQLILELCGRTGSQGSRTR